MGFDVSCMNFGAFKDVSMLQNSINHRKVERAGPQNFGKQIHESTFGGPRAQEWGPLNSQPQEYTKPNIFRENWLGISPFKGLQQGGWVKQHLGALQPQGPPPFSL